MDKLTVRRLGADPAAELGSWAAVRELCCRTGDNGAPIARERWELFSRIWIEPYAKLLPQWTYVAEIDSVVVGYLTGCPDSKNFYGMRQWRVTLPMLIAMFFGRYRRLPGAGRYVRRALGIAKHPERCFSAQLSLTLARDFPAHLHMNVDADHRRSGVGRLLMERYFADLRRASIIGVHLFCGTEPLTFYRRLGFQVLETVELNGVPIFSLGRRG